MTCNDYFSISFKHFNFCTTKPEKGVICNRKFILVAFNTILLESYDVFCWALGFTKVKQQEGLVS